MRFYAVTLAAALALPLAAFATRPPRPTLSGPTLLRSKTHVLVHYTQVGSDSTSLAYAETTGVWAESAWARMTLAGWYPPAPDQGVGGDDRYDMYLKNRGLSAQNYVDSAYTDPYVDGVSCWIETTTDTNAAWRWLHAVVCHEFIHSCHGRVDNGAGGWINEQTACYMTRTAFPGWTELTEWSFARWGPQKMPWQSINCVDSGFVGPGSLWLAFLDQYYGSGTVRKIWDLMGHHAGQHTYYDMDSLLRRDYQSRLDDALGHYAVWRYFTGARDDSLHFRWPANESLCACSVHARHTTYPASGSAGREAVRGPGGMNVVEFVLDGTRDLDISFDGQDGYRWRTYVLCLRDGVSHEQMMVLDANGAGAIRVPASMTRTAVLIPVALDWGDPNYTTPPLNYTYSASLADEVVRAVEERPECGLVPRLDVSSPVSSGAVIHFRLASGVPGRLTVADASGRKVRCFDLVGTGNTQAVRWERDDGAGRRVPNGLYFCWLDAGNDAVGLKLVVK